MPTNQNEEIAIRVCRMLDVKMTTNRDGEWCAKLGDEYYSMVCIGSVINSIVKDVEKLKCVSS